MIKDTQDRNQNDWFFNFPSIYQQFDLNKRLDHPLIPLNNYLSHQNVQRVVNLALPFINLYQPASQWLSVLQGSLQLWNLKSLILKDISNKEWKILGQHALQVALITTDIVLLILSPTTKVIFSGSIEVAKQIYLLNDYLKQGDYKKSIQQLAVLANQLIYMAFAMYANSEFLLASLILQATAELYRCHQEWQKGDRKPESFANLLMASLRLYQASLQARVFHRNYFGYKIEQKDIPVLMADIQKQKSEYPERLVDFEKILTNRYYSSKIHNISFNQEKLDLTNIFFKNIFFLKCDFSRTDFTGSVFHGTTARHCNFLGTSKNTDYFDHFNFFYQNYFGLKLKQADISAVLADIQQQKDENPNQLVDFEKILTDRCYSNRISNISFNQQKDLTNIFFKNIFFLKCNFSHVDLSDSVFYSIIARQCDFSFTNMTNAFFDYFKAFNCNYLDSLVTNTYFTYFTAINCDFSNGGMSNSYFTYFTAINSNFNRIISFNNSWGHCYFEACKMEETTYYRSNFTDTHFYKNELIQTSFYLSSFKKGSFNESVIIDGIFAETTIQQAYFQNNALFYSSFNSSKIEQTSFDNCQMEGVSFFEAYIKNCQIKDSDLTDCLLLDNKDRFQITGGTPLQITKPVIGLIWNFESSGAFTKLIHKSLIDSNALILRFDYRLKQTDHMALNQEVKERLEQIEQKGVESSSLSISDTLLTNYAGQEIQKIKVKTEEISNYIHGLLIPGGDDIESEFYGQKRKQVDFKKILKNNGIFNHKLLLIMEKKIDDDDGYQRTIFELGMISQAIAKKLPIQGICRGAQIVNVFLGGTLKQHVDDHFRVVHTLKIRENGLEETTAIMKSILQGDQINGLSMHHQAIDQVGKGLEVILEHERVPEALISKDGKIVLTQFHPEAYLMKKMYDFEKFEKISKKFFKLPIETSFAGGKNFFRYLIQQAKLQGQV